MVDNMQKLNLDDLNDVNGGVGIVTCEFNKNTTNNKAEKGLTLSSSKSKKDVKFFDVKNDKGMRC